GVISASGTLGQIIPPSIVIILLGSLAGDLYAVGQGQRAALAGCVDALTYLGKPAVVSVGTLFQAAFLPGIMLAVLYALYAFGYALFRPEHAPPILDETAAAKPAGSMQERLFWIVGVPALFIIAIAGANAVGIAGSQSAEVTSSAAASAFSELRTNVSEPCKASMIELHGQEKWDRSITLQNERAAAATAARDSADAGALTDEATDDASPPQRAPLSNSLLLGFLAVSIVLAVARGITPELSYRPLLIGAAGVVLGLVIDAAIIRPTHSPGETTLWLAVPIALMIYGSRDALIRLSSNDVIRVVFPPAVLIVAVLGSILGGITNPTPAAALGAAGALMLAAYRKLDERGEAQRAKRFVIWSAFAVVILILVGVNFDLRATISNVTFENWVAIFVALAAYHLAFAGLLYSCYVLFRDKILTPIVHETAKVTSMVFTILIGSQMLNLVVISFGGEDYVQSFLRSFDNEIAVFLLVMLVLFVLGFVLDFLEIIYIVIPIVGPVIYGGSLDPKWVTIMIAINLQTSFLTPPFGFALFYLRGVAPPSVTTGQIYRGVIPFVIIQIVGLGLLWLFPSIVTILPDWLPGG
ncbi:MAG: TRAP transporter large permease subunit, partial [Alphaproteobacteria bacterium]